MKFRNTLGRLAAKLWTAVTCHRFVRLADLSVKQGRAKRHGELLQPSNSVECIRQPAFDGDKSTAESAARSAHSKAPGARTAMSARIADWKPADKAVRAPAVRLSTGPTPTREFVDVVLDFIKVFTNLTTSSQPWRRYRVAPRANPAAFRHSLLLGIQLALHRAGLAGSRKIVGRTTL